MIIVARRHLVLGPLWFFWGYLAAVTVAELVTAAVHPQWGLLLHAVILVGLTIYGALGPDLDRRRLALALMLGPLIRLLSLSLPLTSFPQMAWYPLVSIPLLIAMWIIIRQSDVSRSELGLRTGNWFLQLLLVGGGLGLGVVEYLILQPAPLLETLSWQTILLPALSLIIFTGFTEEIIFRGLLQSLALRVLGRWALIYVSLLFAVLHIGYLSFADVVFVFAVGLLFAYIVQWGGSILGVTLAHGATNVTLFLIMPYVAETTAADTRAVVELLVWVSSGLAVLSIGCLALLARRSHMSPSIRSAVEPSLPLTQLHVQANEHVPQMVTRNAQPPARRSSKGRWILLSAVILAAVLQSKRK